MGEHPLAIGDQHRRDIIVWIAPLVATAAIADLEEGNVRVATVNQLMGDALGRKPRAHPRTQHGFPGFGNQYRVAFQYEYELVLFAVAMQQGRFTARTNFVRFTPKLLRPKTSPSWRFSRPAMRLKNGSG